MWKLMATNSWPFITMVATLSFSPSPMAGCAESSGFLDSPSPAYST